MMLVIILGAVAILVLIWIVILYAEQRDKEYRQKNNLPAKKYHDITDEDVTTIYTIRDK